MKTPESAKYLNVLLNFLGFIVILSLFGFISYLFNLENFTSFESLIILVPSAIYLSAILAVVVMLKRVVKTIIFLQNPLVKENVTRFKKSAYIFFAVGTLEFSIMLIAEIVINEPIFNYGFIFPLFIGCVILVLADVFKFAITIKEDNDLTV